MKLLAQSGGKQFCFKVSKFCSCLNVSNVGKGKHFSVRWIKYFWGWLWHHTMYCGMVGYTVKTQFILWISKTDRATACYMRPLTHESSGKITCTRSSKAFQHSNKKRLPLLHPLKYLLVTKKRKWLHYTFKSTSGYCCVFCRRKRTTQKVK